MTTNDKLRDVIRLTTAAVRLINMLPEGCPSGTVSTVMQWYDGVSWSDGEAIEKAAFELYALNNKVR